nr:hypothetical protein [Tanacetum cinerariifolium]
GQAGRHGAAERLAARHRAGRARPPGRTPHEDRARPIGTGRQARVLHVDRVPDRPQLYQRPARAGHP